MMFAPGRFHSTSANRKLAHLRQNRQRASLRLLGDIGATNARFGLQAASETAPTRIRLLPCADFDGLEAAIRHYLQLENDARPDEAVLSVATPVSGAQLTMTNRNWSFSVPQLRARCGFARLQIINDFSALALALPGLAADERRQIGGGAPQAGSTLAVLGPGSGLGVSGLLPFADGWLALASEGGHVSMPARNARESEVLGRVRRRFGHASAERVLSGPGLEALHDALREIDHLPPETRSAAEVSARGVGGECRRCVEALELFCAMLGTVASDLVLTLGARGGLYIGGGIVPQLGDFFAHSPFRARFEDKGRYSAYLAAVPTYVIDAPYAALSGAARAAESAPELGFSAEAPASGEHPPADSPAS